MFTKEEVMMAAPCGISCGECPAHTCKDNPAIAEAIRSKSVNPELIPCNGCRTNKGICAFHEGQCATYDCVQQHKVTFCFECNDYPCSKLYPSVDRAEVLPHNMKMVNLAFIQNHGIQAWLKQSKDIQLRYYKGKMAIGKGPQLIKN